MITIMKFFAGFWFVLVGFRGHGPRDGEAEDALTQVGRSRIVDWTGKALSVLGAVYLFREVYSDVSGLFDGDKASAGDGDAPNAVEAPNAIEAPMAAESDVAVGADPSGGIGSSTISPQSGVNSGVVSGGLSDQSTTARSGADALVAPGGEPATTAPSALENIFGDLVTLSYPAWSFLAAIVAISAVIGMARGAVREMLTLLGWLVAGLAAFLLTDWATAAALSWFDVAPGEAGSVALLVFCALFVAAMIIANIILARIARGVSPSAPGRAVGFVYGAARGVVLVSIFAFLLVQTDAAWPALSQVVSFAPVDAFVALLAGVAPESFRASL